MKIDSRLSFNQFQSTPPARGATVTNIVDCWVNDCISIHAPREGGDHGDVVDFLFGLDFNPRPPRGGRLKFRLILK